MLEKMEFKEQKKHEIHNITRTKDRAYPNTNQNEMNAN